MSLLDDNEKVTPEFLVSRGFTINTNSPTSTWYGLLILLPPSNNPFLIRPYYQIRYYVKHKNDNVPGKIILRGEMGTRTKTHILMKLSNPEDILDFEAKIFKIKQYICNIWDFKPEELIEKEIGDKW